MSLVPEKDFSEGLHLDVPRSQERPWRCLRKSLRIWSPLSFLFPRPRPVVFMLVEKKMINPPADTLATFQAGRKEMKRKEKRQKPVESVPLYSGEEQLSLNPTDVCLHLVARIPVTWQPPECVTGNAAALDRIRVLSERGCWEDADHCLPSQGFLRPIPPSADTRVPYRKQQGLSGHR